jgi:N4-gp56 family major capsid protein
MPILTTTSGGPEGILRNYWKQRLMGILENQLMAADLCDQQVIPANVGTVIEFHRINSFPKQVTGVTQYLASLNVGVATAGSLKGRTFTVDSVVYSLELLTNDLFLSEQSIMTAEPNPVPTLTDRFLYNAKDTIDQRIINIMVSNTGSTNSATAPSVTYFGASTSTATTWGDGSQTLTEATLDADNPSHRIAAETFNSAYTALRSRSAKPRMGGGRNAYDCLISPEVAGDLRTDATFQDIALKGNQRGEDKFEKAMIGEVFGVRVIEDENVSVNFPGTVDTNDQIVRCPVVGEGYCARISHAKGIGVPQVNFIPPGKADKADPYGLVGIMTWKIYQANGGVLNPLNGQLIKVATTRAKSTAQDDDSTWQ